MLRVSSPLIICLILILFAGCHKSPPAFDHPPAATRHFTAAPLERSLPLMVPPASLEQMIVRTQHKRVWGRLTAIDEVERIVHVLGPYIEEGSRQPAVQPALRMMAATSGISLEQARQHWIRLHEADILLESGGQEDAVSVANAVGVSQWVYSTGIRAGLKVDLTNSDRLTAQIRDLRGQERTLSQGTTPAPGRLFAPESLDRLRVEINTLREQRKSIDQRYDQRLSIIAQARYLLRLYPRFPDSAWVMQAFHGGEAGVVRTLKKYLGASWPGSSAAAIKRGNSGHRLTFERVYLTSSPYSHAEAFSYLFGRGDDHRYYWWKVRSAMEAFDLYRKNPGEFHRRWLSFLPGRPKEAAWYPEPVPLSEPSVRLAPVVAGRYYEGRKQDSGRAGLKPESKGALLLIAELYRRSTGGGKLIVGDRTLSPRTAAQIQQLEMLRDAANRENGPAPELGALPGGGPPAEFNYHVTGMAFDIVRPNNAGNRKMLEYALGWLSDREIIWWRPADIDSSGPNKPHYHVVPNPRFRLPLEKVGLTGNLPRLPAP